MGAGDLLVVGVEDGIGQVHERGACVGDVDDGLGHKGGGADLVPRRRPGPVPWRGVDGHVGDVACVLGWVDEAEVVGTGCLGRETWLVR